MPPLRLSLTPSRPLLRTLRCALLLGVGLSTAGSIALAAPAAIRAHQAAPKPKPRRPTKPHRATVTRTSAKPRPRPHAEVAAGPLLPTLPAAFPEIPSAELLLQPGQTMEQAFATLPIVPAPTEGTDGKPLSGFSASAERLLSAMMSRARSQLGTRYVFGGDDPDKGLDCSSFARFAMEALGIRLPRTAAQQARVGTAVPRDRKLLRPGDLLTFGRGKKVSHVGIYLGEGHFIHASVSSGRIIETTIERNGRLFRRWQGARRLIADNDAKSGSAQSEF